jgi:hypothetical protein
MEERRRWGKRCRRVNMVQILCARYVNGRMSPVEIILGMGVEDKGESWRR